MNSIPLTENNKYTLSKNGVYGEMGYGANTKARFLLTTLSMKQLERVSLIADIRGSEKWSVRDLFQREVDIDRVENSIVPYFEDRKRVKFFNPLTLTLLPLDPNGHDIKHDMPDCQFKAEDADGHKWNVYEVDNYYKLKVHANEPSYSHLAWSQDNVRVVAIDGQHRLTALQHLIKKNAGKPEFEEYMKWSIPVVIIMLGKDQSNKESVSMLGAIRNIFIYINSEAKSVNPTRTILLKDESVNAICAQELLDRSHSNDVKEGDLDPNILPLVFFDWRGAEKNGRRIYSPAYIKTVNEIHDWLRYYLLGKDFSKEQELALNLEERDHEFEFNQGQIHSQDADVIRDQFKQTVLPGISIVLERFRPYASYIKAYRDAESQFFQSHIKKTALAQLKFGYVHNISVDDRPTVNEAYQDLTEIVESEKLGMPELVQADIGMRGIMYAFSKSKEIIENKIKLQTLDWAEHAEWFIEGLNVIYDEGWIDDSEDGKKGVYEAYTHITHDERGSRVNYRLEDAEDGFGSMIMALVFSRGKKISENQTEMVWDEYASTPLLNSLQKGYRKEYRAKLKDKYPNQGKELAKAAREEAEKASNKQSEKIRKILNI